MYQMPGVCPGGMLADGIDSYITRDRKLSRLTHPMQSLNWVLLFLYVLFFLFILLMEHKLTEMFV